MKKRTLKPKKKSADQIIKDAMEAPARGFYKQLEYIYEKSKDEPMRRGVCTWHCCQKIGVPLCLEHTALSKRLGCS